MASENIFYEYDDSLPASILFSLSNGNQLRLYFSERGSCVLIAESRNGIIKTPKNFKEAFDVEIGFVPILGPVEQHERLFEKEAARLALQTSGASRNFRNIWHHFGEDFDVFRNKVRSTWPGMDIERPELNKTDRTLLMFCPEERHPREICWSGYGFQVWCQMLTFIVKSVNASLLVIDEPDIYLHSDLQRQLVALLRDLGPDILLATHSTEIIAECEPTSLLNINKNRSSANRVKDVSQLKRVFEALGSNLNPILTQIAKTRRVVFVEGLDFQILSPMARALGFQRVANRSDFAVIQMEGFNPRRAVDLAAGIEKTVGSKILRSVVLDRDYRSDEEILEVENEMKKNEFVVHIHGRKEIENYLLVEKPLKKALNSRLRERERRSGKKCDAVPDIAALLNECLQVVQPDVFAQILARYTDFKRRTASGLDLATVNAKMYRDFDERWRKIGGPEVLAPGKEVLAQLNKKLQEICNISLSDAYIANQFSVDDIQPDLLKLFEMLNNFGQKNLDD